MDGCERGFYAFVNISVERNFSELAGLSSTCGEERTYFGVAVFFSFCDDGPSETTAFDLTNAFLLSPYAPARHHVQYETHIRECGGKTSKTNKNKLNAQEGSEKCLFGLTSISIFSEKFSFE